jgi:hypothetical protein
MSEADNRQLTRLIYSYPALYRVSIISEMVPIVQRSEKEQRHRHRGDSGVAEKERKRRRIIMRGILGQRPLGLIDDLASNP